MDPRRATWRLLLLLCPTVTEQTYTQQTQSKKGVITKGSELSGMKVCITSSSKPPRTPEVIVSVRGFQNGIVEEGEEEAHWQP